MSMTKPVIGVAIMMMMEEGKVRLTDPVSKFIPEFKDLKVAVPHRQGRAAGRRPTAPAPRRGSTPCRPSARSRFAIC